MTPERYIGQILIRELGMREELLEKALEEQTANGGLIGEGSSPSSLMRSFGRVGSAIGVAERRARV